MHISEPSPGVPDPGTIVVSVCRFNNSQPAIEADLLAVEEPLEIRVHQPSGGKRAPQVVSVTMRTPGHDSDLAIGFLFTEGIVTAREQVLDVHLCKKNVVRVDLRRDVLLDLDRLDRHFYTASSCGVCGKTSIAAVRVAPGIRPVEGWPIVEPAVIQRLPGRLLSAQVGFERTGGLHAAALFDIQGNLLCVREDVGRHNALDKLVGAQFLAGHMPLNNALLLVSGRASFELVQKAAVAGIPMLAAVAAPSSLAVELADEHGLTLVGFVRHDRLNVYTDAGRIQRGAVVPGPESLHEERRPLFVL